jgi:hypothetical protein
MFEGSVTAIAQPLASSGRPNVRVNERFTVSQPRPPFQKVRLQLPRSTQHRGAWDEDYEHRTALPLNTPLEEVVRQAAERALALSPRWKRRHLFWRHARRSVRS